MTTETAVVDRFCFLRFRLTTRVLSSLAMVAGLCFWPVDGMAQTEPGVTRSKVVTQRSVAHGEPLYYYKGRTRVQVELDLTRVAVDETSAPAVKRNAARAGVSLTTHSAVSGKAFVAIPGLSRKDMMAQADSLRRSVPGVPLQ